MNQLTFNKIALGKKLIDFIYYEAIIEKSENESKLIAVNVLANGKILTKIKTNISLSEYELGHLDRLIIEIISSFISDSENNSSTCSKQESFYATKPSNKQKEARNHVAQDLFNQFNL